MRKQCFPPEERLEFPFLLGGDELSTTLTRAWPLTLGISPYCGVCC